MLYIYIYIFFNFLFCLSSLFVFISKNPVHSILFLVLTFCNCSALLFLLNIEFLGIIFIIIYIGAVAVLFLFVIMMLNLKDLSLNFTFYFFFIFLSAFIPTIQLFFSLENLFSNEALFSLNEFSQLYLYDSYTNIEITGLYLYNYFLSCFLIAGLILLVAIVGAICLTVNFNNTKSYALSLRQLTRSSNFLSFFGK